MRNVVKNMLVVGLTMALPIIAVDAISAKTTIQYASWYQNPEDVVLIKKFMELNPDIKVNLTVPAPLPGAANWMRGWVEKLLVGAIGGVTPDVMRLNHETVVPFFQAGLLADMGSLIKRSKFDLNAYFKPNVELYAIKGKQVGIPLSINNYAVFYNKKMLAESGVADLNTIAGSANWTREAFLEMAKKLTKDTNGDRKTDIYGVDDNPQWVGRDVYVPQAGGQWFTPDGKKCTINSAEAIDGLRFMHDMKFAYKVWSPNGWATGLWEKKAAMMLGAGWVINRCLDAKIDFDTAPVFQYKAKKWFPAAGDGIGISANSKKKDAAWKFIQFMSGRTAEDAQAKAGIITPALIASAYGDAFVKSAALPKHKEAFFATIENTAVFEPRFIKNEQSVFEKVTQSWVDLWAGKKSPQKIAGELQSSINRLL